MEKINENYLQGHRRGMKVCKSKSFDTKIYPLLFESMGNKVNWKSLYYVHFFQLLLNGF
jgi:hypothetical protein